MIETGFVWGFVWGSVWGFVWGAGIILLIIGLIDLLG